MKRNLLYLLMVAMFAIVLSSCGGDDDEPTQPTDYNKVGSIIGEWSCQYELKDGKEVGCDQFIMNFNADGKVVAQYSFAFTRSGSYTFNDGTVVCTFANAYTDDTAIVTMKFSDYNQGRAKVETVIDYKGDGRSQSKHTYLFYKL